MPRRPLAAPGNTMEITKNTKSKDGRVLTLRIKYKGDTISITNYYGVTSPTSRHRETNNSIETLLSQIKEEKRACTHIKDNHERKSIRILLGDYNLQATKHPSQIPLSNETDIPHPSYKFLKKIEL